MVFIIIAITVKISWFDFALAIIKENKININLKPISTKNYATLAKRPKYSVLDKSKMKQIKIKVPKLEIELKKNVLFTLEK